MNVRSVVSHAITNWKTTVSGFLTSLIGLSAVASTPNPWIKSSLGVKILGAAAIAKVVLGMIQTDGSQINVHMPDNTPVQVNLPAGSQVQQTTTIQAPEKEN